MPAPIAPQNKYSDFADRNSTYIQKRNYSFQWAYDALQAYNYLGTTGTMPTYTYTSLDSSYTIYFQDTGVGGELAINGNAYSSCSSEDKINAYKYLDLFFKECMHNYNINYSL